ncbi:tyrosine-protein phosphatase [Elysia marginata]|uniref:Tyrosine-protein phosphatase n=1 Tax=Elysia marginata TaxID=1093978 RepID=A0AAV4J2V1_9GAST|nr:tyrosine-protein phosphatase [Elysia marginata]
MEGQPSSYAKSHHSSWSPLHAPKIGSLPNLRLLCRYSELVEENVNVPKAAIYRSSKPDRLNQEDLVTFRNLGIKCIIDFRSKEEYFNSDGQRLLDGEYILHKVTPAKKAGQTLTVERIDTAKVNHSSYKAKDVQVSTSKADSECLDAGVEKKHFLINFFTPSYIFRSVSRLPCYLYCVGLFHFLCDFIRRDTSFKRFGRFFTRTVINRIGIKGQYADIADFCQPAICSALKLISDPHNSPMLLNCAHGKDRTGIVSALVLTCIGVPREDILYDYSLSEEGLRPIVHLVRQDIVEKYQLKEEFISADADTMRNLLDHIERKYGSISNYMEAIGFSREEQMSLKTRFTPPESLTAGRSTKSGQVTESLTSTGEENVLRSRVGK